MQNLKNSFFKDNNYGKVFYFTKQKAGQRFSSSTSRASQSSPTSSTKRKRKTSESSVGFTKIRKDLDQGWSLSVTQSLCVWIRLLLGVRDLHGAGRRDPEALQRVFGHARLRVALKFHEGDVVFPRDEPDLFEPRKPAEDTNTVVNTHDLVPVKTWT